MSRNEWDELAVAIIVVVQRLRDDHAFKCHATSALRFLLAIAPQIGFGANQQHEISRFDLVFHPALPTFRWKAVDVLVKQALQPICAQTVRYAAHKIAVQVGIVAVADENLSNLRHVSQPRVLFDKI